MEKRRVRQRAKPAKSLRFMVARQFARLIVSGLLVLLAWYWGLHFCIGRLVWPADHAQAAAQKAALACSAADGFEPALVDELTPYIVFDKNGAVLSTNMTGSERERAARNYRGDSVQNGLFYPVFYSQAYLSGGRTVMVQYDFRLQYIDPALRWLPDFQVCYVLALAAAQLALLAGYAFALARRLKQGIDRLEQAGAAIAAQNLSGADDAPTGVKEIDSALQAMHTMRRELADSLQRQWAQRRRQQAQVAALAHDLKTPLTVIGASAELLQESLGREDPAQKQAAAIVRNAQYAGEYLARLCGTAAGGVEQPCRVLELGEVLRQLGEEAQSLCAAAGAAFCLEHTGPQTVYAAPEALRRALTNLLDNAARYSPPGGRVLLRVYPQGGGAAFAVQDEGPGFSAQALRSGGELFFTENTARSRGHFGFGLAYAAGAAQAAGGWLRLENAPEGGARAVLWLPGEGAK